MNPYTNLGFNPVPGVPADLDAMLSLVRSANTSLTDTNRDLGRLQSTTDGVWKGDAANAFRQHFDQSLGVDLRRAQDSLTKAVGVLDGWRTNLISHRDTASGLDTEMAAAKQAQTQAQTAYDQAKEHPDLDLIGKTVSSDALAGVQARIDSATAAVNSAKTTLTTTNTAVKDIVDRVNTLKDEHSRIGRVAAQALRDAATEFAPNEPGLLDRLRKGFGDALKAVGEWISKHKEAIRTTLSIVSAVSGVLALFPPLTAVFGPIALAAGAGVLAMDLSDPELRNDLLHGSLSERLGAGATLGLDALAVLPGAKGLTLGAKAAFSGADDVGRLGGFVGGFSEGASSAGIGAKIISGASGGIDKVSMKLLSPTAISHGLAEFGSVTGTTTTQRGAELLMRAASLGGKGGTATAGGGD